AAAHQHPPIGQQRVPGAEDDGGRRYGTELSGGRVPQLGRVGEAPGEHFPGWEKAHVNSDVVPGKHRAPLSGGCAGCALRQRGGRGSRSAGPVEIVAASLEIVALIQLHRAALYRLDFGLAEALVVYRSRWQGEASALVAARDVIGDPHYAPGLVGGEEFVTADVHQIDGVERPIVLPPAHRRSRATGRALTPVNTTNKQSARGKRSRE